MSDIVRDTSFVSSLRKDVLAAWGQGNSICPRDLTAEQQVEMILDAHPRLCEEVWEEIRLMIEESARFGFGHCDVRFEAYRHEGGDIGRPIWVHMSDSAHPAPDIVVTLGVFNFSGLEPVSLPFLDARKLLANTLQEGVKELAEKEGLGVWSGISLDIWWIDDEEERDIKKAIREGGYEAMLSGVPVKDIIA